MNERSMKIVAVFVVFVFLSLSFPNHEHMQLRVNITFECARPTFFFFIHFNVYFVDLVAFDFLLNLKANEKIRRLEQVLSEQTNETFRTKEETVLLNIQSIVRYTQPFGEKVKDNW